MELPLSFSAISGGTQKFQINALKEVQSSKQQLQDW